MSKLSIKVYDLYWLAKQKHQLAELKRVVKEAGLEGQLVAFPQTKEDYLEEAKTKLGIEGNGDDEPVAETPVSKSRSKKPITSIGIDEDD